MKSKGRHRGGNNGKSPKLRHRLKREAEQNERKAQPSRLKHTTVKAALAEEGEQ